MFFNIYKNTSAFDSRFPIPIKMLHKLSSFFMRTTKIDKRTYSISMNSWVVYFFYIMLHDQKMNVTGSIQKKAFDEKLLRFFTIYHLLFQVLRPFQLLTQLELRPFQLFPQELRRFQSLFQELRPLQLRPVAPRPSQRPSSASRSCSTERPRRPPWLLRPTQEPRPFQELRTPQVLRPFSSAVWSSRATATAIKQAKTIYIHTILYISNKYIFGKH